MPISREPITVPRRSRVSPPAMSEPAKPTNWPGAAARRTAMRGSGASSSGSVCSTMTTASAPRGIGAPVATAVAVPGATTPVGATPQATISSFSRRETGAVSRAAAISAARTAKPSTAERSKGGTSPGEATSSARTRPSASESSARSVPTGAGLRALSKRRTASSRGSTVRNCSWARASRNVVSGLFIGPCYNRKAATVSPPAKPSLFG